MTSNFRPVEWLCAALSQGGAAENFKVIKIDHYMVGDGRRVDTVRVLHKETGAVWQFACDVEREAVK